jgi:regulator of cell morphogenesis and NO signaling
MQIHDQSKVGELVAQDYRAATVFQSYGIDFCCKGHRTIAEACQPKNISSAELIHTLEDTMRSPVDQNLPDFKTWPADLLTDYIEKKHHRYTENRIREIKPFLHKVAKVHGDRHPELLEVEKLFNETAGELAMHMKKEELVLFPYIRKLYDAKITGKTIDLPHFGTVKNPISAMLQEHDTEGERFRKIAGLTKDYTPPDDACNTYRVTFALLQEFEQDLHMHIHLENNILFPIAIEMELAG